MAVTVTNTTLSAYDTETTVTANAATSSVVDATEAFTITPTKASNKVAIIFTNGAGHGAYTWSLPVGDLWASDTATALTGSIADGATEVIQLEDGKHLKDGKYIITLTPASGKRLLTDHAASMEVLELA